MDALRPRTLVELGTQAGLSYSAFAQAVQTLGIDTACYAVDTWEGDEHAGFYDEKVFAEWSAFHSRHFGGFSRLIRSTFDEALTHFSDGSIDALHIDGLHTYEAVRHDFESWLPKLSDCSVVLFHDVNVREREFGVWRYWEEMRERYPLVYFHSRAWTRRAGGGPQPDGGYRLAHLAAAIGRGVSRCPAGLLDDRRLVDAAPGGRPGSRGIGGVDSRQKQPWRK